MDDSDTDLFSNLINRIDAERAKTKDRSSLDDLMLDISRASMVFLRSDHQKVMTMWNWFRPFAVLAGIAAAAVVGAAVTGHVSISIVP